MLEMLIQTHLLSNHKGVKCLAVQLYSLANNIRSKYMHGIFAINLESSFIFHPDNEIETNITKLIKYRANQSLYNGNNAHDSLIIIYKILLLGVYIY